tara:strand:+ start:481 stop:1068 length:588 start_codon:yes stop_codon:yes gene_type:complete
MELKNKFLYIFSLFVFSTSCSFYSFKGSLPPHIDNIAILPIINNSKEYIVLDVLNDEIYDIFLSENVLKLVDVNDAKSTLEISVVSVTDNPYTFSLQNESNFYEQVTEWKITIKAKVDWYDLVENKLIFSKEMISTGLYSNNNSNDISDDGLDNDEDGLIDSEDDDEFGPPRESALKIASKKMSEDIISNITSTW